MTIQIALDAATNDIIKTDKGIARVDAGRYTTQLVKNRLLTYLGEWRLDPTRGWLSITDFEKNPDMFDIEVRATKVILETPGVNSVDYIDLSLSQRVLTLTFRATTVYGEIDLTIPWST